MTKWVTKEAMENRKKRFLEKMNDPEYLKNSYQNIGPAKRRFKSFSDVEDFDRI